MIFFCPIDPPHTPRGCASALYGVGEGLRALRGGAWGSPGAETARFRSFFAATATASFLRDFDQKNGLKSESKIIEELMKEQYCLTSAEKSDLIRISTEKNI